MASFNRLFYVYSLLVAMLLIPQATAFVAKPTSAVPAWTKTIPVCIPVDSMLQTSRTNARNFKPQPQPQPQQQQQQHRHRQRCGATPLFQTTVATVQANIRKNRVATSTAFLTSLADVALVTKYKTFATMMTGNTLWLAQAVVDFKWAQACFYLTVIAAYVAGVATFRKMDYSLRQQTLRASAVLVTALFVASDVIFALTKSKFLPVALLSVGFGIINSIGTEETGSLTFVVTGHMTKLTNMLVDRTKETPKHSKRRPLTANEIVAALENMSVTIGFFGGALFGFLLQARTQVFLQRGMFSILGTLFGFMFYFLDMEKMGGAWWKRKNKKMIELDNDGEIRLAVEQDIAVPEVRLVPPAPASTANTTSTTTTS